MHQRKGVIMKKYGLVILLGVGMNVLASEEDRAKLDLQISSDLQKRKKLLVKPIKTRRTLYIDLGGKQWGGPGSHYRWGSSESSAHKIDLNECCTAQLNQQQIVQQPKNFNVVNGVVLDLDDVD
jgi:hypothetical protein